MKSLRLFPVCLFMIAVGLQACSGSKVSSMKNRRLEHVNYRVEDPQIEQIVREVLPESLLKKGQQYDAQRMDQERKRIETVVKNRGLDTFDRKLITFVVDTTSVPKRFLVEMVISKN